LTAHPPAPQGAPDRGKLKRYDLEAWYDWETSACGIDETEHPEGDWVRYAELCAEREAEQSELERLREALLPFVLYFEHAFDQARRQHFNFPDPVGDGLVVTQAEVSRARDLLSKPQSQDAPTGEEPSQ